MSETNREPPGDDKHGWRQTLRLQRRGLTGEERLAQSKATASAAAGFAPFASARTVAVYAPTPYELDPAPLTEWLHERGVALAYPRVVPRVRTHCTLELRLAQQSELKPGFRGILEPDPDQSELAVAPDIVLVPGLAFDGRGIRLGYGAACYDCLMRDLREGERPPLFVGYAYAFQRVDALPSEPHDQPVDAVITPDGVFHSPES